MVWSVGSTGSGASSDTHGDRMTGSMNTTQDTAPQDPRRITQYHAHVYYDPATNRDRAALVRECVAAAFPDVRLGNWHERPVGPHPQPMYQIAFPAERLADVLPWLMLNRLGLTVLVHPEIGDDYADHAHHAAWLGAVLPLRLEMLTGSR